MPMKKIEGFGKNFRALLDTVNVSVPELSKATGLSLSVLNNIGRGIAPALDAIIKVADFFAVPLDFLCDRTTEQEAREILADYGKRFMALRRAPYEAYLRARVQRDALSNSEPYDAPWPYNLLNELFGEWGDVLTEEQERGMEKALSLLKDNQRTAVEACYRDSMRLRQIEAKYGASKELWRQNLIKGVRSLKAPHVKRIILLGPDGASRYTELQKETDEMNRLELSIKSTTALLAAERQHLAKEKAAAAVLTATECGDLDALGLSPRAVSALENNGLKNVADVLRVVQYGNVNALRRVGVKIGDEIRHAAIVYTERAGL